MNKPEYGDRRGDWVWSEGTDEDGLRLPFWRYEPERDRERVLHDHVALQSISRRRAA